MAKTKTLTGTSFEKPEVKPQTTVTGQDAGQTQDEQQKTKTKLEPVPSAVASENDEKVASYKRQLIRDAQKAQLALVNNGTGDLRKNVPFRPYEETRLTMVRLAADLTEQRGELVKVHDIMIEAMNDYFKKHGVNHVAQRPSRKKK